MKLLFIITGLSIGGAEKMLLKISSRIDGDKFDLSVISLTGKGEISRSLECLGIPVYSMGMSFTRFNPLLFFRLIQLIVRIKPDVVQTWLYHGDLIGGLASRLAGVTNVCWNIRNCNLDKDKTKWSTRLVVKASAFLSKIVPKYIVCNSNVAAKIHQDIGYSKSSFKIIPNGFDASELQPSSEFFEQIRNELGISRSALVVGHVARFDPHKNHLGLIQAISRVNDVYPNIQYLLCGTNVDASNILLNDWIRESKVENNVHLLGSRNDVPQIMASLDLLVSSSVGESFPNVLGEAMACGVPCVTTDVGDSAYVVGETGGIVLPNDVEDLASSIIKVLNLSHIERKKMGYSARKRIIDHFSLESVVHTYEELYLKMKI